MGREEETQPQATLEWCYQFWNLIRIQARGRTRSLGWTWRFWRPPLWPIPHCPDWHGHAHSAPSCLPRCDSLPLYGLLRCPKAFSLGFRYLSRLLGWAKTWTPVVETGSSQRKKNSPYSVEGFAEDFANFKELNRLLKKFENVDPPTPKGFH